MDKEKYIEERVEVQINWYDNKSKINQRWFKCLNIVEMFCAILIPFVACFLEYISYGKIIIGILGIIVAMCAGVSKVNKYLENWLTYRTTCETLQHEKYLFLAECSPYDGEKSLNIFVKRIESLISKENSQWSQVANEKSHNKYDN